jgi:hypothetical protein
MWLFLFWYSEGCPMFDESKEVEVREAASMVLCTAVGKENSLSQET